MKANKNLLLEVKDMKTVSPTRYSKILTDDLVDFVKDQDTGYFLPYHNGNRLVIKARAKSEV